MKAFLDFSDDQKSWQSLECGTEEGSEQSWILVPDDWKERSANARYYRIRIAEPATQNRHYIVVGGPFPESDRTLDDQSVPEK